MINKFSRLSADIRQYCLITTNYWAFTLTDGALRMLVVLHFHQLGYTPLEIAFVFIFYELFGVVTNLLGGWLGARIGLNNTMNIGLGLQIIALSMLLFSTLTVPWVMAAQALSGIAKDLNKMSAKSAIKLLTPDSEHNTLYRWVTTLTGSKNTLKGIGFFMGGALLVFVGFQGAIIFMASALTLVWLCSLAFLKRDLGKPKNKPKFTQIFSHNRSINFLSAARCFLFGARDVWFVIALPVYFTEQLQWPHWQTSSFLALWIIAYGMVQIATPTITGINRTGVKESAYPTGKSAFLWACPLAVIPLLISFGISNNHTSSTSILIGGLIIFGILFAINSSIHSFLIVHLGKKESISLDVGFYYMANAMGRLMGTLLSGFIFQLYNLHACLLVSTVLLMIAALLSLFIQPNKRVA